MKKAIMFFMSFIGMSCASGAGMDFNAPKTITADKIEYDLKSETIKTVGKTEITSANGQRLTLNNSYVSKTGESLSGDDIRLWLGQHVYVESDNITRDGNLTIARNAEFTACYDCDPYGEAWTISATKIVHNMRRRMLQFYNPVLWVYDTVPVFWFPFFEMPDPGVKYKTGFLMPSFQSTNKMGTQINIPVYISISDTHDLTFTPSYLTQENPLFQLEHRLNTQHAQFRTNGSFTHNKEGENRWHVFNDDIIELGEYTRATVYLQRTSDKTYLQKYGFYDAQPYLDSGAKLELFGQSGYVVADTHIFQELRSNYNFYQSVPTGNILPNIRGVYQTSPIYGETYALVNADVLGISGKGTASQRVIGDARIVSPWTLWGGNRLTLSVDARYDVYNFDNTEMIDGRQYSGLKNRFLPSGYAEWGLPLFRAGNAWTQIIEPRARLTVMRHTDTDEFAMNNDSAGAFLSDTTLFSDNRFSGYDLWENGTFADYGVRWAAFNNDGRMFEVFLGQSYDFTERQDTDPNSGFHDGASDYVGRVEFNNSSWLRIASRFRMDRYNLSLRHAETSANIGSAKNYIHLGHIWSQQFVDVFTIDNEINEAVGGIGIQLTDRWSARFNAIYNMTYGEFQRHSGGLFYTHPCYYLSVEYRRDNAIKEDYVGDTTFQFRFGMSIDGQQY
ncbi:MAG: LPS assembly protein LptD [Alphaproteobacteria bacterium]|nr:LPS assembly protein LptD [Alphaproteobacteria bacterium]